MDGTANAYLALSAIIAAGMDGIERSTQLPDPVQVNPSSLTASQLRNAGVEKLPKSLSEAMSHFTKDSSFFDTFSDYAWKCYKELKSAEINFFHKKTAEEEVAVLLKKY